MIQTVVSNASAPEYGQATISFPIREEDYPNVVNMLQSMGLGDPVERDCRVDEVCGDWPILKRLEKVAINLDEMDYLAKRLDSFDAQEKAKFQAAARQIRTVRYEASDRPDVLLRGDNGDH